MTYTRASNFGKIRPRYNLKDSTAIVNKNLYLRLILAINNNQKRVSDIVSEIEKRTGEVKSDSNLNKPLNDLIKSEILEVEDYEQGNRGPKKIIYEINYLTLTKFILENVLFDELNKLGLKSKFEEFDKKEIITTIAYLLKKYLSNFNKYLDDKNLNSNLKDNESKQYFQYVENLSFELKTTNKITKNTTTNSYGLMSLVPQDFTLKEFIEGFFKYLISDSRILHHTLRMYYKTNKQKNNYVSSGKVDILLLFFELYFSKNRCEILSKLNQHYEKNYIDELKNEEFNFENL